MLAVFEKGSLGYLPGMDFSLILEAGGLLRRGFGAPGDRLGEGWDFNGFSKGSEGMLKS